MEKRKGDDAALLDSWQGHIGPLGRREDVLRGQAAGVPNASGLGGQSGKVVAASPLSPSPSHADQSNAKSEMLDTQVKKDM
jgi:hypothetical protein